jgi:hypothetical protein
MDYAGKMRRSQGFRRLQSNLNDVFDVADKEGQPTFGIPLCRERHHEIVRFSSLVGQIGMV